MDQWFYRVVLVAWPKENSVQMDCHYRLNALIKNLERRVALNSEPKEPLLETFKPIFNNLMAATRRPVETNRRLLRLCIGLNAVEESARLLAAMQPEDDDDAGGICDAPMADMMVKAVKIVGWAACSASLAKLVVRLAQMPHYTRLAQSLLNIGWYEHLFVNVPDDNG